MTFCQVEYSVLWGLFTYADISGSERGCAETSLGRGLDATVVPSERDAGGDYGGGSVGPPPIRASGRPNHSDCMPGVVSPR